MANSDANTEDQNVENQNLDQTVVLDANRIKSGQLKLQVDGYPLLESDFDRLTNFGTGWKEWAKILSVSGLGALFVILGKGIDYLINLYNASDKNVVVLQIQTHEWISIGLLFVTSGIFLILGRFWKNKKDKLIARIKEYYESQKNAYT